MYVGAFEAVTTGGTTTYRYHLSADSREVAEVDLSNSGSSVVEKISYVLSDHLGSVDVVETTDVNGNVLSTTDMSFSAWGNRREANTWLPPVGSSETQTDHQADRYGFTHQEMLDNVNLIHMNGRIYDPNLGRFLSVDPVFEFPTNTQSLNPYSYVLNNPLSMTDPTGYAPTCVTNKDGSKTCTGNVIVTGTHIAQKVSATVPAKGGAVKFSGPLAGPGGNSLMLGSTMMTASVAVGGNGAQTSQGAADAQQQPTQHTDIGSPSNLAQQMAKVSSCVYDPSCTGAGDWSRLSGIQRQQLGLGSATFSDSHSGLRAGLFENSDTGAFALAFAGTYDLRDLEPSIEQLMGARSPQFDDAVKLTQRVERTLGSNLTLTGHSLGGALAAVGALATHTHAITFNAEGLSGNTISRYRLDMSEANSLITNYHTALDPLTIFQDITPLPDAVGRQATLPGFHLHGISGVCTALNTQC